MRKKDGELTGASIGSDDPLIFFEKLQSVTSFSEEQLDAYLCGDADEQLCREIESDPGYIEWISDMTEDNWDKNEEERINRVLAKVNTPWTKSSQAMH